MGWSFTVFDDSRPTGVDVLFKKRNNTVLENPPIVRQSHLADNKVNWMR